MKTTPKPNKPAKAKVSAQPSKSPTARSGSPKNRQVAEKTPKAPEYDRDAILSVIADGLADGTTLRSMCRRPGMPHYATVYRWIQDADEETVQRIVCAREAGYDAIADEILEIVDESTRDVVIAEDGTERTNTEVVARSRLRAEIRLKLLAKWSPKRYGEKVQNEHTGPSGGNIPLSLAVSFVPSGGKS